MQWQLVLDGLRVALRGDRLRHATILYAAGMRCRRTFNEPSGNLEDVLRTANVEAFGFLQNTFAIKIEGSKHCGFI